MNIMFKNLPINSSLISALSSFESLKENPDKYYSLVCAEKDNIVKENFLNKKYSWFEFFVYTLYKCMFLEENIADFKDIEKHLPLKEKDRFGNNFFVIFPFSNKNIFGYEQDCLLKQIDIIEKHLFGQLKEYSIEKIHEKVSLEDLRLNKDFLYQICEENIGKNNFELLEKDLLFLQKNHIDIHNIKTNNQDILDLALRKGLSNCIEVVKNFVKYETKNDRIFNYALKKIDKYFFELLNIDTQLLFENVKYLKTNYQTDLNIFQHWVVYQDNFKLSHNLILFLDYYSKNEIPQSLYMNSNLHLLRNYTGENQKIQNSLEIFLSVCEKKKLHQSLSIENDQKLEKSQKNTFKI